MNFIEFQKNRTTPQVTRGCTTTSTNSKDSDSLLRERTSSKNLTKVPQLQVLWLLPQPIVLVTMASNSIPLNVFNCTSTHSDENHRAVLPGKYKESESPAIGRRCVTKRKIDGRGESSDTKVERSSPEETKTEPRKVDAEGRGKRKKHHGHACDRCESSGVRLEKCDGCRFCERCVETLVDDGLIGECSVPWCNRLTDQCLEHTYYCRKHGEICGKHHQYKADSNCKICRDEGIRSFVCWKIEGLSCDVCGNNVCPEHTTLQPSKCGSNYAGKVLDCGQRCCVCDKCFADKLKLKRTESGEYRCPCKEVEPAHRADFHRDMFPNFGDT